MNIQVPLTHSLPLHSRVPLQINGVSSQNLSLDDTRRLIEKSEGRLTLLVLRDRRQFLVNLPPAVSDSESDNSLLEGEGLGRRPPPRPHVPDQAMGPVG